MTSDPQARADRGLDAQLRRELDDLADASARRALRPIDRSGKWVHREGRRLLNLAGNDYLGLAQHPALIAAAIDATRRHGTGGTASRLVTGTLPGHEQLERRFAAFKHAPAALLFPTGYMANLGTLTALARPGDVILQDKRNHASLLDAARFSGATVRTFPHRRYDKLEALLERARDRDPGGPDPRRVLVVTDSVFSMDGDVADLPRLVTLAERFGATLVADEAHATGVLGDAGGGLAEMQGVAGRVHVTISTASKALGSIGGVVTGSRVVIDTLVNRARPFIYTTAGPPSQPAVIAAALELVRDEPHRRHRLRELSQTLRAALRGLGWGVADDPTPIVPLTVGGNDAALALEARLDSAGILAVAIRPPTVPPGSARVRLTLRADLDDADLERLLDAAGPPSRP